MNNINPHIKLDNCENCHKEDFCLIIEHVKTKKCMICSNCFSVGKCLVCQTLINSKNYGESIFNYSSDACKKLIMMDFFGINHFSVGITNKIISLDFKIYCDIFLKSFVYNVLIKNFRDCDDFLKNETLYGIIENTQYNEIIEIMLKLLEKIYYKQKRSKLYKLLIKFFISLENSEGNKHGIYKDFYKNFKFYKENINIISQYSLLGKCDKLCNIEIIILLLFRQRDDISLPKEIIFMIYKQLFKLKPCRCLFILMDKNILNNL